MRFNSAKNGNWCQTLTFVLNCRSHLMGTEIKTSMLLLTTTLNLNLKGIMK